MILLNTNKIRNKTFDSILELCEDAVDTYESLNRFPSDEDTSDISFIAKYDEAKEIISYLCKLEYDMFFVNSRIQNMMDILTNILLLFMMGKFGVNH